MSSCLFLAMCGECGIETLVDLYDVKAGTDEATCWNCLVPFRVQVEDTIDCIVEAVLEVHAHESLQLGSNPRLPFEGELGGLLREIS